MADTKERAQKIARLNDMVRTVPNNRHKILMTPGITHMSDEDQQAIFRKVKTFDNFSEDNDPHSERDFGSFKHADENVFWKIDYYNLTLEGGSEDPANPDVTTRVLTIMLAHEY